MKTIKVCYSDVNNMGDRLNKDMIEKVFNCRVKRSSHYNADIIAIGSGLGTYLYGTSIVENIKKKIVGLLIPKVNVWGTGFINYPTKEETFYKRNIRILAVRGELTRKRIEKILNKEIKVPTADGGLLASFLLSEKPQKRYSIGIIPHFREKDNPCFKELLKKFENSTIIDVQDTPYNVTKKIAECECVISSSLHGLIISDSLGIPNAHLVVSNKLLGDGYKFDDYYSCYGLKHDFIKKEELSKVTTDFIKRNYKVPKKMVEEKKKQLIDVFPYK